MQTTASYLRESSNKSPPLEDEKRPITVSFNNTKKDFKHLKEIRKTQTSIINFVDGGKRKKYLSVVGSPDYMAIEVVTGSGN